MEDIFGRGDEGSDFGGVSMEEYLETLLEQVRCEKARPMIEKEVREHIEDQAEAYWVKGMDQKEALACAVKDMGDPVEAGVELDRIHRPKMAWDMIAVMTVISLMSIAVHIVIGKGAEEIANRTWSDYIFGAVLYVGTGFFLMLLVYRLDYSIFARYGKLCAQIFLAVMTLEILFLGLRIHGNSVWIGLGNLRFSLNYLMFLYAPLYGAVLYWYHGRGWKGLLKAVFFLLYPVWLMAKIPCVSFSILLFLILSVMLVASVLKDWFLVSKKVFLAVFFSIVAIVPAGMVFLAVNGRWLEAYRRERIMSFLQNRTGEYSYVTKLLFAYTKNSRMFGSNGEAVAGHLPDYYNNYILTFLSCSYGFAAACIACTFVFVIAIKAFRISFHQSNRLGMMMGLGSGLVLLVNTVWNIGENFGVIPTTTTFLPFFSYTGTGIVVSYILLGIVLSVYRHKNIFPAHWEKVEQQKKAHAKA